MADKPVNVIIITVFRIYAGEHIRSPHPKLQDLELVVLDKTVLNPMEKKGRTGGGGVLRRSPIIHDCTRIGDYTPEIKPFRKRLCDWFTVRDEIFGSEGDDCPGGTPGKDDIVRVDPEGLLVGHNIIDS